jgi:hypothetical protein
MIGLHAAHSDQAVVRINALSRQFNLTAEMARGQQAAARAQTASS